MITKVTLNGFNGFDCDYCLGQHTLITGDVGSGKSTIWQAIQFALSPIASTNMRSQFDLHYSRTSTVDQFYASVDIEGVGCLARMLKKTEKGITQMFYRDAKVLTSKEESILLKEVGIFLPSIHAFLEMSDQKQIAYLCQNFGSGDEIETLTDEIERLRGGINDQQNKITGQRGMLERMEAAKAMLPTYTEGAMSVLSQEIAALEKEIKEEEIENARRLEKERMEEERLREVAREEEKMAGVQEIAEKIKENEERILAPSPTIRTLMPQVEPLNCSHCVGEINCVIEKIGVAAQCHSCGQEQILSPALIPLKLLRKKMAKGVIL